MNSFKKLKFVFLNHTKEQGWLTRLHYRQREQEGSGGDW
uniref:Uncharacterized protein n=1 Tax=Anguilla anguilla TaxID=7936 RepID=A0A0E9UPM8_ANGAN